MDDVGPWPKDDLRRGLIYNNAFFPGFGSFTEPGEANTTSTLHDMSGETKAPGVVDAFSLDGFQFDISLETANGEPREASGNEPKLTETGVDLERPVIQSLQTLVHNMKERWEKGRGRVSKKLFQELKEIADTRWDTLNQTREDPLEARHRRLLGEARGFSKALRELAGKMWDTFEEKNADRLGFPIQLVRALDTLVEGRAAALANSVTA